MRTKGSASRKVTDTAVAAPSVSRAPATIHPLREAGMSDSLVNMVTGMGTGKDKTTSTQFVFTAMDRTQVEAAYRGDWISRKVIDIPSYDATREWRTWQADTKDIGLISDLEEKFAVQRKTMAVLQRARLYGGAALIIGVDQGKPEDPLELDKLGKDCLKFLHVVNRYEINAGETDWDIMSPYFGTPKNYTRSVQGTGTPVTLHPSRVIRFLGAEIPDITQAQGWGDSTLQIVADAVISMSTVAQSITSLVQEAKVDIVKIPELSERISDKKYEDRLKTRFAMAAVMKSIYSVLLIDREEDWERVEQQFTGMPELMQEFMIMVCGAADIPATRFLGQSPKGMNATGDSDTRNYYDRVSTEQKIEIQPQLSPLDTILQISAFGKAPDGMSYNWNPLWQMDEAQKADIAVKKATVMTADVAAALMDPMVLQKARENQLIEDGTYPGLEAIIEEFGTDIDSREPDINSDLPTHIDPNTGQPADPTTNPDAVPNPAHPLNQAAAAGGDNVVPITKGKKKGPPVPGKKAAANDAAIESMTARIRDAQLIDASTPRTLYVYRPVLNYRDIAKHYKALGVDNIYGAEMHVTICYSKTPVDWLKVGADSWGNMDDNGNLQVRPGGPRVNEQFGKFLVLAFSNSDLQYRHCSILERTDGSWDYDDFTPHVSISSDPGAIDPLTLPAYMGEIVLGPEVFEEIKVEGADYGDMMPKKKKGQTYDAAPEPQPAPAPIVVPAPVINVTIDGRSGKTTRTETLVPTHDEGGRVVKIEKTITETPSEE